MATIQSTRPLSSGAWGPIQMSTTSNKYKYSLFPRTIIDWNRLKEEIIMIDNVEQFKKAAANCLLTYCLMFLYMFLCSIKLMCYLDLPSNIIYKKTPKMCSINFVLINCKM